MKELKLQNNKFLGYFRVSSKDQSRGVSQEEQQRHILEYAKSNGFKIVELIGGVESASKPGRELFAELVHKLKKHKLRGAIFHKVDRSGRNPKEQSELYELMLEGYEFHFVAEHLSTSEPLGRNMMYMLWGMASAYSENLKMEVNKGIMGMLREGRCPNMAPLGYLNIERGIKHINPKVAPLIKQAFELYASGNYDILALHEKLKKMGLRRTNGTLLHPKMLYKVLRNPFYYGIIRYRGVDYSEGQYIHRPIITKQLYDKVQVLLDGKSFKHKRKMIYQFQHMISCRVCGKPARSISAKKRYKYYVCRNKACKFNLGEVDVEMQFEYDLSQLEFNDSEVDSFLKAVEQLRKDLVSYKESEIQHIDLRLGKIKAENERLLTAFLQQNVTDDEYKSTKSKYTNEEIELNERRVALEKADEEIFAQIQKIGKLLKKPSLAYRMASEEKKRALVKSLVENFSWNGEKLITVWKKEFQIVANRPKGSSGRGPGT